MTDHGDEIEEMAYHLFLDDRFAEPRRAENGEWTMDVTAPGHRVTVSGPEWDDVIVKAWQLKQELDAPGG